MIAADRHKPGIAAGKIFDRVLRMQVLAVHCQDHDESGADKARQAEPRRRRPDQKKHRQRAEAADEAADRHFRQRMRAELDARRPISRTARGAGRNDQPRPRPQRRAISAVRPP